MEKAREERNARRETMRVDRTCMYAQLHDLVDVTGKEVNIKLDFNKIVFIVLCCHCTTHYYVAEYEIQYKDSVKLKSLSMQ